MWQYPNPGKKAETWPHHQPNLQELFFSVGEKAMASSPCDFWTHLSDSLSPSPPPSSISQTSSSSTEHVWNDIKLASLSNTPVDLDFDHHSSFTPTSANSFLNHPPSTVLTLSSTPSNFHQHNHHSLLSVSKTSFDASDSNSKKTTQQDQRHMRIIKNRESAVRSRARKQAYKKGLEVEIARLTEENSRLRTQLEELQCRIFSSENPPRMGAPCRTSSSPF
ncbi:FD protein [Spatholobus suberectus]|nr:FD protein [Spatholobus suberectus]